MTCELSNPLYACFCSPLHTGPNCELEYSTFKILESAGIHDFLESNHSIDETVILEHTVSVQRERPMPERRNLREQRRRTIAHLLLQPGLHGRALRAGRPVQRRTL